MPTVEFSLDDLNQLLGRDITLDDLEDEYILYVKGEVEGFDGTTVKCDMKDTNRPDLWSIEGIARELRGHLGIEEGPAKFDIEDSGIEMMVEKKVDRVRAKTVAAVVKGLSFNDEVIKQVIQLQEKIAMTHGRNRDLAAIGVYDYDRIVPPVIYTTVPPDGIRFVPLDFEEEMTPGEILERHPKGREYGHLIEKYDEYPLMIDSAGNVLSIPPIINSVYTGKVTEETENVFIEITGHEVKCILIALNVLTTALADRGGQIQTVRVVYPDRTIVTPDLSLTEHELDPGYCRRHLGLELGDEEMVALLRKARYDAEVKGDRIIVQAPGYRNDIMHQADIAEDVAIAYDLNKMAPEPPSIDTIGSISQKEVYSEPVREVMVGLGYQEVLTFSLTNKDNLFEKMNMDPVDVCEIANPVSASWTAIRSWLLPSIMEFLTHNLHNEFPQKVFEVGDVSVIDESQETLTRTVRKLACARSDTRVSYEEVSSDLDALMQLMDIPYTLKAADLPFFIPGRGAEISSGDHKVGFIGEVHPQVIASWRLEKPVVAFELDLDGVF